jgi:hypothetical protein
MSTEYQELVQSISRAYISTLMQNDTIARQAAQNAGKSYGISAKITEDVVTELTRHMLTDPMVGILPPHTTAR